VAWESGWAINGDNHAIFSPYVEADVGASVEKVAASPAASSPASAPASSPVVWTSYFSQTDGFLEDENR